jgi:signal transduction histidine kinase
MKNSNLLRDKRIVELIIDRNVIFTALLTIPLNYIVYMSLETSNMMWTKISISGLSVLIFMVSFLKKRISLKYKYRILGVSFMLIPIILLRSKLLDVSIFWFAVSTTYFMYVINNQKIRYIIGVAISVFVILATITLSDNDFIPKTSISSCYKQCMIARFIKYIIVGVLVFHIFSDFMSEIGINMKKLKVQADDLKIINETLKNEIIEKKKIQHKALGEIILAEEKERKRIAADLHDGIGPVMSSINLYYQAYIDEKNPEKKIKIEKRLKNIIDAAISDVSKISHNISPNILENNGLIFALDNFINQIGIQKKLNIIFNYDKIFRFDIKKELTVYRAVTELINNTLKYANASEIIININTNEKQLIVDYYDNGIGFDKEKTKIKQSGIGLYNINNRMTSLQGRFGYETSKNNGFQAKLVMPFS